MQPVGDALDIRVLGTPAVLLGYRSMALGGPRELKLFCLLAVNANSVVSLDRIVGVLWDDPPDSVRQQIHNVVGGLRRSLRTAGRHLEVVTTGSGYQLRVASAAVDAFRFRAFAKEAEEAEADGHIERAIESLRRALSEWSGPAFGGLPSSYLQSMATLLDDERLAAAERLAELQLRQGNSATPTSDLQELVAEYPFRESLRALLMRALHQSGRQVDALAVFEDGRKRLASELGLDPGPKLRAAQQLVLIGETATEPGIPAPRLPPADGAERAQTAAEPRNFLPRDIPEFTGRDDEVERLMDVARSGRAAALIISAINGMGGVGKTTLAIHLAHHLAADYPDGQYYIDLLGYSAGAEPMTPLQALDLLLHDSGKPPELIAANLHGRSAQWRSTLAGRRSLLLLDNAADTAQVRPLIPGSPGTLVLISSRRRMPALEGAVPLSLDVMPNRDAISLFEQIVGAARVAAEFEAATKAVELCGRLPLAIQIAAARLRDRPGWPVGYLVEQLQDQRSRARILTGDDRDVMSVLAWSYRHLTPRQQTLFRLLGIHSGPDIGIYAAAALAGLPVEETAACLEDLYEVNLLRQDAPGRYRMHDLVRDSSRDMLRRHRDGAELTSATQRLLDYYLRSANLWCKLTGKRGFHFEPDVAHEPSAVERPATVAAATHLLDAEYRNLVAAVRLATETESHPRTWQLTCSLLPYFAQLNYGAEAEGLLKQALRSARQCHSQKGESMSLAGLACAKRARGLTDPGRELMIQAIDVSQRLGDLALEIFYRTSLGHMFWVDNRYDDAADCFTSALDLARKVGDQHSQANLVNNLGVICQDRGKLDEAMQYFQATLALDLDDGTDSPELHVLTMCNVGLLLTLRRRYAEAVIQLERALQLSRSASTKYGEAKALICLCSAYRLLRGLANSLAVGRRALEIARKTERHELEIEALNALCDTYLALKDLQTAEHITDEAYALAVKCKSARFAARSREARAHVMSAKGDPAEASKLWQQALDTYPGGVVDPAGARRHLAASGHGLAACWRCE